MKPVVKKKITQPLRTKKKLHNVSGQRNLQILLGQKNIDQPIRTKQNQATYRDLKKNMLPLLTK